ncbi:MULTISPECIES: hypothetical protein [Streptomyces]|uniref:Secreted protein n=1 Tax=Streptomyces eurythermus TaxID=42237 RepID=A0ABW6Z8C8_9ACTN|nr:MULTISPECIES: hypothetical protein [Streptomyces]QIS68656.1 hypothetical protein HB370_00115 [Streptomyces sp. DSM 40868]
MSAGISRRTLLSRTAAVAGGAALASLAGNTLLAPSAQAAVPPMTDGPARDRVTTGEPSLNGWEMEKSADDGGNVWTRPVLGTPLDGVQIRMGDVETVLVHTIQRFHYEIDTLRPGDVGGWQHPAKIRKGLAESNLASGTAIQIRPGFYPSGQRGGYFPNQLVIVRDILADLEGVVRWGGDDKKADEALFYITVKPGNGHLVKVADKLRGWAATPGEGAGSTTDPFAPKRRRAAERLARLQA